MYKLSRYWNKMVFLVMGLVFKLIWDHTGGNQDILKNANPTKSYAKFILTSLP